MHLIPCPKIKAGSFLILPLSLVSL